MSDNGWNVERMLRNAGNLQVSGLLTCEEDAREDLRGVVEKGRSVVLFGRSADLSRARAELNAAEDVCSAAESLYRRGGVDVHSYLPDPEVMAGFLRTRGVVESGPAHGFSGGADGVGATSARATRAPRRRMALMRSGDGAVIVCLVAGQATGCVESGREAFAGFIADLTSEPAVDSGVDVGALWFSRVDRLSRSGDGIQTVLGAIRAREESEPVVAGDGCSGVWETRLTALVTLMGLNTPESRARDFSALQAKRRAGLERLASQKRGLRSGEGRGDV